eukprot:PhF_6_TR41687/c0_g1_i2/m.63232
MNMNPRSVFIPIHGLEIHVTLWETKPSTPTDHVVIMWHGLTRTGRDFDPLARYIAEKTGVCVLCPDTVGRGLSSWSTDPAAHYNVPFYVSLAEGIVEYFNIKTCDWIGTSMGGLIAMVAHAISATMKRVMRNIVLNDIGPIIDPKGLARIKEYSGKVEEFPTFTEFHNHLSERFSMWGASPDMLMHLSQTSYRRLPNGYFTSSHDPNITRGLPPPTPPADPWALYRTITKRVLVIRGGESDILSQETAEEMTSSGSSVTATLVVIPGVGHAPGLESETEKELILNFISAKQ